MNNELGILIPLNIRTVTPLHIGGNDLLSPLADYWMDEQKNIHLVNEGLLAAAVYDKSKTNEYIKSVEQVATEKKGKMLYDFVKDSLHKDMPDLLTGIYYKSFGIENPIEIDCCIQTDGMPYIPGSSIKGALRSAILQNWLSSGKAESNKALNDFLDALRTFSQRNDLNNGKKISEIEKVFREKTEESLFGGLRDDNRLAASCLRVNDTGSVRTEKAAVYQLDRFNLLSGERNIPVLKQCIDKDAVLSTTVNIDYYSYREKKYHGVFKDILSKAELFALINSVTLHVLNYEFALMGNKEVYAAKLKAYEDFMGTMKERIEQCNNKKAFMRLGFGKMQFYQTIAMSLFAKLGRDEENAEWVQYLCYCNKMSEDLSAVYPSTRVLTSSGQLPLGWIELE